MSKRKGEEEEKAGPSRKIEKIEEREHEAHELYLPSEAQFSLAEPSISGQQLPTSPSSTIPGRSATGQFPVPQLPLRVKRPGRPRIHPPKPVGISKPRGRPRGSKNKKPRKRREILTKLTERPPKRPRGRPRKWPPEMWEGFQRSQLAAVTHQMQPQIHRQTPPTQEMPGPSHLYYEDQQVQHQLQLQEESSGVPPPLSHLPFHLLQQQEPLPELLHLMPITQQSQHIPQQHQQHHFHPPMLHHQLHSQPEDPTLVLPPHYHHEEEQQLPEHLQQQQREMMMPLEEQQAQYYHEQIQPPHPPPPHTTS